jgi:hypothetical protein
VVADSGIIYRNSALQLVIQPTPTSLQFFFFKFSIIQNTLE